MTTQRPEAIACPLGRRALLGGAAAMGAAYLLSACAGDAGPGDTTPTAGTTQGGDAGPRTTTPTAGTTQAGDPPAGASPVGPAGALVRLADVPVGGGVIAPGPVLVVRTAKGQVKAYDATCPHQAITIGVPDSGGRITCPGHGGHFNAADGARIDGPAQRGLTAIDVLVTDGYVVRT